MSNTLLACEQKFDNLLLSQELWAGQHQQFSDLATILNKYHVEVIFIVRPPVLWANSAWWQWHNFNSEVPSVESWIDYSKHNPNAINANLTFWPNIYTAFDAIPYVKKINLLALQANIIQQIYKIMDLPHNQDTNKKSNTSSSAEMLYFLSLHKELRPMHSPGLEFTLNRLLKKRSPTPWVLSRENVEDILRNSKEACLELAKHISNENILENPLWWDVAAYERKIASYNRDINLPYHTVLDMLSEAYVTIGDLDKKLRHNTVMLKKNVTLQNNTTKTASLLRHQKLLNQASAYAMPLLHLTYLRYRIFSELTFGKTRQRYKFKKNKLGQLLKALK